MAEPAKATVTLEFYQDGTLKNVLANGARLKASTVEGKGKLEAITTVGVAFLQTEPASPRWCCVVVGGVLYCWQC
jgi:hypothetical protein